MHARIDMFFSELTAVTNQLAGSLEMEAALGGLLDANFLSVIERSFAQIEIAEAEIGNYCQRFPNRAASIQRTFLPLRWRLNEPAPEPVFRHHVQELLQRVVDDESLAPGARAEALIVFHVTSLKVLWR